MQTKTNAPTSPSSHIAPEAPVESLVAANLKQAASEDPSRRSEADGVKRQVLADLLGVPRLSYQGDFEQHLLEMYKLYVETTDKVSDRRQNANSFFLAINTALVAMLAITWPKPGGRLTLAWFVVVALAGAILSYSWYRALRSYKDLNEGRFKVIHAIEDMLPVRPYAAEWTALGRGEDKKLYLPFSKIERKVPWAFLFLFSLAAIGAIAGHFI